MSKIRYLSLFSGIGAFEKALNNIGINYELVGFSEIDKYAIKSYCAIHKIDESLNLGDIREVSLWGKFNEVDLITHGSPCQDFSIAGLQAGGDINSKTRSSLMWETIRIIKDTKPKYVIWENVKNVLSKKHRHNFDSYIEVMQNLGYNNYYEVLNAKDYNIPQNRERIYCVSIQKDIDKYTYVFPKKMALKLKLKDILEDETKIEDKYYLNNKIKIIETKSEDDYKKIKVIGKLDIKGHDCIKRIYDTEGIAPTLTDMQGGHRQPKIIGCAMRGRYNKSGQTEQKIEINNKEYINTITTVQKDSLVSLISNNIKIRKLTPLECFRLMGFTDEDFYKAKDAGISDTQLYKQAGNSIVVNVLEEIFKNLFF